MENKFSWMQIHTEGKKYTLYLYNQKGVVKKLFSSPDLEAVQNAMEHHTKMNEKIGKALSEAIHKTMTDPQALERLKNHHEQSKTH